MHAIKKRKGKYENLKKFSTKVLQSKVSLYTTPYAYVILFPNGLQISRIIEQ